MKLKNIYLLEKLILACKLMACLLYLTIFFFAKNYLNMIACALFVSLFKDTLLVHTVYMYL